MEKKNMGLIVLVIILSLLVVGLGGFIVYDKVIVSYKNSITNEQEKTYYNDYQRFANNLKGQFSKYDSNNKNYQYIANDIVSGGYEVYLTEKGSLYVKYFDTELDKKYGNYKIADNVLSFYVVKAGQGGGNCLYFINQDGTVGRADTEYNIVNGNKIEVNYNIGYKNIVTIVNGTFGNGYTGVYGPIFIDIDGNVFSENLD